MQKITTVGELKKFLNKYSDNLSIYFSDENCEPCQPFSFEIGTVKNFVEEYIEEEYQKETYNSTTANKQDIVIYAEF